MNRKTILNIVNKDAMLDLHHAFTSEKINIFPRKLYTSWYRKNMYYSIMLYFILLFRHFFDLNRFKSFPKKIPVLLIANTVNQRNSISPIKKIRKDAEIFGDYRCADFVFPMYKS